MNRIYNSTKIIIRGISLAEIREMIKTCNFEKVDLEKVKIKKKEIKKFYKTVIEPDKEKGIHYLKQKEGGVSLIVSDAVRNKVKNCWHCKEKEGYDTYGYPLEYTSHIDNRDTELEVSFVVRGFFCDEICSYWYCKERSLNPDMQFAINIMEALYELENPGMILPDYKDSSLLIYNGGGLQYDQWKNPDFVFEKLPGHIQSKAIYTYKKQQEYR